MKKLIYKPSFLAVLFITVYLLGLVLGMFSIIIYPVYHRQKNGLFHRAEMISAEYLEGVENTIEYIKSPTLHILIYDAAGNCQQHITSQRSYDPPEDDTAIKSYLKTYLPSPLNGQNIFAMAPSFERPKNITHFCLIAGVPIIENGTVVGSVFLVRLLENLQEAYLGYMVYFSILYWTATYFIITYIRKKRKLEEIQQNYIANVTHALKSPIASVKAITETLSDVADLDPDKRTFYYGMILRETNLQSHMVQEILELSKLQSHGTDFTKTSVSAAETFEPVLGKFSTLCDCAHISFSISNEIAQLPPLYTNASCIGQVLDILLENAVKYVNSGDSIWFDVTTAKKHVIFCVKDNGSGISKEDLPHVFERFYRCSRNVKTSSGLGLAIAKELIDNLMEKIWVESELGEGTAFYFTVHTK